MLILCYLGLQEALARNIVPTHHQTKKVGYSVEKIFDLVIDVTSYPDFLPWCISSSTTEIETASFHADLLIGFKIFRENFGSRVEFKRPQVIEVTPTYGPFRKMRNTWTFEDKGRNCCLIDFYVDFEFRSLFLNKVMGLLFYEAVKKMVDCFEKQASQKYGPPVDLDAIDG